MSRIVAAFGYLFSEFPRTGAWRRRLRLHPPQALCAAEAYQAAGAATGHDRKPHFDGLRGIAALMVVIAHLQCFAAGPEYNLLTNPAPTPYFDGATAVCIFFVLSGIVLWEPAPTLSLLAAFVKRYIRLTLVILATSVLSLAIAVAEDGSRVGVAVDLLARFPGWFLESIGGIYVTGTSAYNPALWTMRPELLGSFGVFVAARIIDLPVVRAIAGLAAVSAFALYPTPTGALLLLFAIGVVLRLSERHLAALPRAWRDYGSIIAIVAALTLGAISPRGFSFTAILIVLAVCLPSPIQRLCATAAAQWLGRVSFALYLTHVAAITLVLDSGVRAIAGPPIGDLLAAFVALVFSLTLAVLFTEGADIPVIKLSRWVGARLSRQMASPMRSDMGATQSRTNSH